MATVNVTETPTTLDTTGAAELAVTNTGAASVYVNTQRLRPGQRNTFDTSRPLQVTTQPGQTSTVDTAVTVASGGTSIGGGGGSGTSTPYGLSIGVGNCTVPIGGNANLFGNLVSNGTDISTTGRIFVPLADAKAGSILPVYANQPNASGIPGDTGAPNDITIAAAVEASDGTVIPFTFNGGQHTVTIPRTGGFLAIPDNPLAFGAQVTDPAFGTGIILRTYVTVAPSRADSVTTTSGSATVTDTAITAADTGRLITGTGIPSGAYVGTVTPGASFLLSTRPDSQVNYNANATGTVTATIKSLWALNWGTPTTANNVGRNNGANGVDLTIEGSAAGSAGFTSNANTYGPVAVLGPTPSGRKPIALTMSDSIFGGATDAYLGPSMRAATALKLPHVRVSKVSETIAAVATPVGRRYRATLIPGTTHAVVEYGTNDGLDLGTKATAVMTNLTALGNYLTGLGIKVWLVTVPPKASATTDGYSSTVGQTPYNTAANLATVNGWMRSVPAPFSGFIDMNTVVSTATDSGLWKPGPNSRRITDAVTTSGSNVVTSATAAFTAADVGTGLFVAGALTGTTITITAVTDANTVTASSNATATVAGAVAGIGAWYATTDGTHPSTPMMTGPVRDAVQAAMATWVVWV